MPRLLAIFSHPDDAELLCAGTLRLVVLAGWQMRIVTLSGGDVGATEGTREEIRAARLQEASTAARLLGGDYEWAGLQDFQIYYCPDQLRLTTEAVRRFSPDVVITHSPDCYLLDHEETSRLVRMACFAAGAPLFRTQFPATSNGAPALYYSDAMEGRDKFARDVPADFWVDIAASFAAREQALSCHVSQREWLRAHHGIDEYLEANERMARLHGERAGLKYAEGFRQHRGHGYPVENRLAQALGDLCHRAGRTV